MRQQYIRTLACGAALVVLIGCGGRQTMASRSAAAYDEARKKGLPVNYSVTAVPSVAAGSQPAGPAKSRPPQGEPMDHAAMAGMDHSKMSATDHSQMPGMDHGAMAGMDHSKMTGMQHSSSHAAAHAMPGMDHSAMPGMAHGSMAGMQHGSSMAGMPGMQHGPAPSIVIAPPATNSAIARTDPAATLRADDFDAPSPAAVEEAAKAGSQEHHP